MTADTLEAISDSSARVKVVCFILDPMVWKQCFSLLCTALKAAAVDVCWSWDVAIECLDSAMADGLEGAVTSYIRGLRFVFKTSFLFLGIWLIEC